MRDAAIFELLEDQLQRRHLLLVRLAHHHRGVAGRQRMRRVGLKLDRAGTVEEGEIIAEEIDGRHVELDAHAVMARLPRGIAHRVAVGHRPLAGNGAGARQYGFEKCRFSAEIGANQCEAAGAAGWLALRVAHDLLPCGYDAARKAPDAPPAQALRTLSCQAARHLARGPFRDRGDSRASRAYDGLTLDLVPMPLCLPTRQTELSCARFSVLCSRLVFRSCRCLSAAATPRPDSNAACS